MRSKILVFIGLVFISLPAIAQTPTERLQQLIGTWKCIESTFSDPPIGICKVVSTTNGKAIFSEWTQGEGDTYYVANALYGYSKSAKKVRVFETNTIGVASTHVGNFNEKGELILELRSSKTNELLEERIMSWKDDTWKMQARFIYNGKETKHHLTLERIKE